MTAGRRPAWCELALDDGRIVTALVFIMDPSHPQYEAETDYQIIAPLIARASGPLGTNAQYLFALEKELESCGMRDDCMSELVKQVRMLLAVSPGFDVPGLS